MKELGIGYTQMTYMCMTELTVVEKKACLVGKVAVQPGVETVLPVCGICASCTVYSCYAVTANDGLTTLHLPLYVWGLGCRDYYAKRDQRLYCGVLT